MANDCYCHPNLYLGNMFEHENQTILQLLQLSVGVGQTFDRLWTNCKTCRKDQRHGQNRSCFPDIMPRRSYARTAICSVAVGLGQPQPWPSASIITCTASHRVSRRASRRVSRRVSSVLTTWLTWIHLAFPEPG